MDDQKTTHKIIIATLSTLPAIQLKSFSYTLSSTFHHHRRRLSTLLSYPALYLHTLDYLYSLSLSQKSLLIARHLLSTLNLLIPFLSHHHPSNPTKPASSSSSFNYTSYNTIRLKDLDAVLLLLLFCEIRQHNPKSLDTSSAEWLSVLRSYSSGPILTLSGIQGTSNEALVSFIDVVIKCRKFVGVKECTGGKTGREVAASVAAVVALPSVEVKQSCSSGDGGGCIECVICKEEMKEGRDVCELPCQHLFHWICVLPWLRKRNTCPCCRFRLPTDDVFGEIERVWEIVVKVGQCYLDDGGGDQCGA